MDETVRSGERSDDDVLSGDELEERQMLPPEGQSTNDNASMVR